MEFISKGPISKIPLRVQTMAQYWQGDKHPAMNVKSLQ